MADGLLIVLPREPEAYLESLRQRDFPHVLIDQLGTDEADLSVIAANQEGGYEATKHLINLGHRRIGIITGWMDMISARQRLEGYKAALAEHGIPYDPSLVYVGDFSQPGGFSGASYFLEMTTRPTAVFASNDILAMGVFDAAHTYGLNVPGDLSVIGFDDIPLAAVSSPKLTTIRQPLQEMGRAATRLLLDLINAPEKRRGSIILPIELLLRESTAPQYHSYL